jgi:ferritin-like metal-binding protein YciE
MAIRTPQEKFQNDLYEVYDAEHHFLKGLEEFHSAATDPNLKAMVAKHIEQTQGHVLNLEQVFRLMGIPAQRITCDGAKGILIEGEKLIRDTQGAPEICDTAILDATSKAEHYEIAAYRSLIAAARLMGQNQVINVLHRNLEQEEQTALLVEQAQPEMLQKAMSAPAGLNSIYSQPTQA